MSFFILTAAFFGICTIVWGAINEARDEMRCTRLFVKERFGYQITEEDIESFRPLPRWMDVIDTIVSPRKALSFARRTWSAICIGFAAGRQHFGASLPVVITETVVPFAVADLGLTNIQTGTEIVEEETPVRVTA